MTNESVSMWAKLPPYEGQRGQGCLHAGLAEKTLPLDASLAVGFGMVVVTCDGEHVWDGDDETVTLQQFEDKAQKGDDADWRVQFVGPMSESMYQRHDENRWVLVDMGDGFA